MLKVVSLFAALICALLFVNVYGDEYGILTSDGKYKHDAILIFTKVLKKLEDFTLPAGDAMLEKWIVNLKEANGHLNKGDMNGVVKVGEETVPVLAGLLPSIPDKIVHAAIEGLPAVFEKDLKGSTKAGGASIADMDKFFKFMAHVMVDAMNKGTPTAETLA